MHPAAPVAPPPAAPSYPLLGDLSQVPPDYLREVAQVKRALERWVMDARFRQRYADDPQEALASLGLTITPAEVDPLLDHDQALALNAAIREGAWDRFPSAPLRHRLFSHEKLKDRAAHRQDSETSHPQLQRWRRRQVNRLFGQLGMEKGDGIVHAPAAFELCRGCSVGCWFCGVRAQRLEEVWAYTEEHRRLWRETLQVVQEVMGECARFAFCYWATDPLDNPDYERFLLDYHDILGRWPQTTTAAATRDLPRTRALLELAARHDSRIDRFSVLSLKMMEQIHEFFTPEELLRVECVPQNKEASEGHRKATAGRAFEHRERRAGELATQEYHSTIACVSGFLFNMVERRVRLITPCPASERWPLGYWVLGEARFDSGEELRARLEELIERCARRALRVDDPVALRRDLTVEIEPWTGPDGAAREVLGFRSPYLRTRFPDWPAPAALASALQADPPLTAGELALHLEREAGVPVEASMAMLGGLFDRGLFEEEPEPAPA